MYRIISKNVFSDLKKLVKYERKSKGASELIPQVRHMPENVINVTIIKEASPTKIEPRPTERVKTVDRTVEVQGQNGTDKSETADEKRPTKNVLRLPKHIKPNNPKVVFKKSGSNAKNGVLVRNTPTDLYQKYQEDWAKFKSYIPGENGRAKVRRSVRSKMQHKDYDDAKVRFNIRELYLNNVDRFSDRGENYVYEIS